MYGFLESICESEEIHDMEPETVTVSGCTMKKDFGPYKKGEKIERLSLCDIDEKGVFLREYNEDGEIVKETKLKIVEDS